WDRVPIVGPIVRLIRSWFGRRSSPGAQPSPRASGSIRLDRLARTKTDLIECFVMHAQCLLDAGRPEEEVIRVLMGVATYAPPSRWASPSGHKRAFLVQPTTRDLARDPTPTPGWALLVSALGLATLLIPWRSFEGKFWSTDLEAESPGIDSWHGVVAAAVFGV